MSTQLKLRRGTTAQHSTFTGAEGEVTVDTTKDTLVVHDGTTAGGVPLSKESALTSGLAGKQPLASELTAIAAAGNAMFKNRIINGAMVIDQRNAGASVTPSSTAADTYNLDRWCTYGSAASKFSVQQNAGSVTPPAGFRNYVGITSLAATSIGASDQYLLAQYIEGFNTADLMFGSASAATVILSFWVRSSLTGTFGGAVNNSAVNRSYPFSYTISAANTWEQKTVSITGDTTGTWLTTNGTGLRVHFGLGIGSTLSGTAGAWAGSPFISATGATSVVGTSGATFYITGVQLEKGSTATSFDYRPYGTELGLCQRYFEVLPTGGAGLYGSNANLSYVSWQYKVTKRAPPTVLLAASSSITAFDYANEWGCNGYSNPYSLIRGGTTASAEL